MSSPRPFPAESLSVIATDGVRKAVKEISNWLDSLPRQVTPPPRIAAAPAPGPPLTVGGKRRNAKTKKSRKNKAKSSRRR